MTIGPAPVLAILIGFLHACLFVVIRGSGGRRFAVVAIAAILGAWTGDTVAGRLDLDPIKLGDFHLAAASVVAWVGIGLVATMASLAPAARRDPAAADTLRLEVRRREPAARPGGPGEPGQVAGSDPGHDPDEA